MRHTVIWAASATARLAELWDVNRAVQSEIAKASDEIDRSLAVSPERFGKPISARTRQLVQPPLAVLFTILSDDRRVDVIFVKFWDE